MEEQKKKKRDYYSQAQQKAQKAYRAKRAKIELNLTPEQKEMIKDIAAKENKSINQFILDCVFNHIENN